MPNFRSPKMEASTPLLSTTMDVAESPSAKSNFPFMKLPPEIRNSIYDLCLGASEIYIERDTHVKPSTSKEHRPQTDDQVIKRSNPKKYPAQMYKQKVLLPKPKKRRAPSTESSNSSDSSDDEYETKTIMRKEKSTIPAFFSPQLLRVSRQVYAETHEILYGRPIFTLKCNPWIWNSIPLVMFLESIGQEIASIGKLQFTSVMACDCPMSAVMPLMMRARALKEFHIMFSPNIWPRWMRHSRSFAQSVLLFFDTTKDWLYSMWQQTASVDTLIGMFKIHDYMGLGWAARFVQLMREQMAKEIQKRAGDMLL